MKIRRLKNKVSILNSNDKLVSLTGYAFIDEHDHTAIIVYGEKKLKLLKEYYDKI